MVDAVAIPFGWERTARAVEKVRDRLRRASSALAAAGVPYAVIGGNAVADWVGRIDEAAMHNTADVDILIRRTDLDAAKTAMDAAGFIHAEVHGVDMFLDGPTARPRDAVHILFAGEKVFSSDLAASPDVDESEPGPTFQVISLDALVVMKLTSHRLKDRVHLVDMIDVGLIDRNWLGRLPDELAERLRLLLDDPHG